MDHVTFRRGGGLEYVDGRIILKAEDGGLLFLARDAMVWRILPKEIEKTSVERRALPRVSAGAVGQTDAGGTAQGV